MSFVPRISGNSLTRRSRRLGMQAHMMPTLISIVDQTPVDQLSHVGLIEVANVTRPCRRTMLTTVTLYVDQ